MIVEGSDLGSLMILVVQLQYCCCLQKIGSRGLGLWSSECVRVCCRSGMSQTNRFPLDLRRQIEAQSSPTSLFAIPFYWIIEKLPCSQSSLWLKRSRSPSGSGSEIPLEGCLEALKFRFLQLSLCLMLFPADSLHKSSFFPRGARREVNFK